VPGFILLRQTAFDEGTYLGAILGKNILEKIKSDRRLKREGITNGEFGVLRESQFID
jgi:hypothetical protein